MKYFWMAYVGIFPIAIYLASYVDNNFATAVGFSMFFIGIFNLWLIVREKEEQDNKTRPSPPGVIPK